MRAVPGTVLLLWFAAGWSPLIPERAVAPRNLIVPPAAETETSVTLFWDKPADAARTHGYDVFQDGRQIASVTQTLHTVTDLTPGQAYTFRVRARDSRGAVSAFGNPVRHRTRARGAVFDVTGYGAVGDGLTRDTAAIQRTIDACTPGGTVRIPAGTFLSGALRLKSGMTLHIARGGVLKGSADPADYLPFVRNRFSGWERETYASLLNAGTLARPGIVTVSNLTLRGEGKIDGGGLALATAMREAEGYYSRGRLVCLLNAQNILIQGLTLENPPSWNLHLIYSCGITCEGLTVISEKIPQADGIDPDSSSACYILNCDFFTSDDCIAIKSGKNPEGNRIGAPTENIMIAYSRFAGHGLSIGSEMSGGVRNVTVRDCELAADVLNGLQIKAPKERGGYVRDIRVEDSRVNKIRIFTKLSYNQNYEAAPEMPYLGEISFANLDMRQGDPRPNQAGRPAILIDGYEGHSGRIGPLLFRNIRLPPNASVSLRSCREVTFEDVTTEDGGTPVFTEEACEAVRHRQTAGAAKGTRGLR